MERGWNCIRRGRKKKEADERGIRGKWYEAGKHMCSKTRKGGRQKRKWGKEPWKGVGGAFEAELGDIFMKKGGRHERNVGERP